MNMEIWRKNKPKGNVFEVDGDDLVWSSVCLLHLEIVKREEKKKKKKQDEQQRLY